VGLVCTKAGSGSGGRLIALEQGEADVGWRFTALERIEHQANWLPCRPDDGPRAVPGEPARKRADRIAREPNR
jgi:hypothetical protein